MQVCRPLEEDYKAPEKPNAKYSTNHRTNQGHADVNSCKTWSVLTHRTVREPVLKFKCEKKQRDSTYLHRSSKSNRRPQHAQSRTAKQTENLQFRSQRRLRR